MSIIGDNIRALREREGITQQELADIAHVTRETVNKWENGTIEALREHNIQAIREHFSLSVDDLRSDTNGLASKQRLVYQRVSVPLFSSPEACTPSDELVSIIPYLYEHHPHAFVVEMDNSMNRTLPEHCHALVDPDMPVQSGSLVLAEYVDNAVARRVVRRLYKGNSKAMLSTECSERESEDTVIAYSQLDIKGVIFWYQASKELV